MLINTADPAWQQVSAAFQAVQGPVPSGLTGDQFAQNCIMNFIQSVVQNAAALSLQPTPAAIQAAQASAIAPLAAQIAQPIKVSA